MTKTVVTLNDKYLQPDGQVMLSALQGVVRLTLDQARRDRAAGLNTGGYITGYRGSPITTLDAQLWASEKLLKEHDIRFEPGLNEELAATSLRGTQQLAAFGKARVDGVFSLWYGKGVGVDRACEALKLANMEGTSPTGGVLVMAGDDHAAKSSASAHQSEHTLIAGFIPVIYPATTDEILAFGQLGWAMSRYSGLYSGFKTITDTLDLTTTVTLPDANFPIHLPDRPGGPDLGILVGMSATSVEALTVEHRLPAAQLFARANGLDRVTHDAPGRGLTVASAGKAWLDLCQALIDLGLTPEKCRALGLRVVKYGLIWPIDPAFTRQALGGSREVLVVEEKRPVMEDQIARIFYAAANAPAISGKTAPDGAPLLSSVGVLDPGQVRRALAARLDALGLLSEEARARNAALLALEGEAKALPLTGIRAAFFCSGCPHNTSTKVPEGSAQMGATGCHGLAVFMPDRKAMPTVGMGSEGMPWVSAQSFVDTPHMFQNLGDGTYTHSGFLSIRASIAAKSAVTFKILYNDAVAMTGGQPAEGALTPQQMIRELVVEGAWPVVLVSDDPGRFRASDLPTGVRILHRDQLDAVQRELRQVRGTSVILYDQTCANEKRRRRKRGEFPDPDKRLFINPAVCEGCGDCSVQSNCLSVTPIETEFGRKRAIDQSSCNKDYSCIKGFCPSFVEVSGARLARRSFDSAALAAKVARLPEPAVIDVSQRPHALLVGGIGGTGVLTVGAMIAMAAHLEGKAAKVLDQTGMAQKGGAVTSHIRIGQTTDAIPSARLGTGQADTIIACDLIIGSSPEVLALARPDSHVLANEDVAPTGEFQTNRNLDLSASRFVSAIARRVPRERIETLRAGALSARLLGDSIYTNLMMVGYAAQRGLLPVGLAAIEEAVRLNGVQTRANLDALALGRLAAASADDLFALADTPAHEPALPRTYAEITESRARLLAQWQDQAWANGYRAFLTRLEATLKARGIADADAEPFLAEAARGLGKLMAYKDEYEVARLYTAPAFRQGLEAQFSGNPRLKIHLAPPLIARRKDPRTGRPQKIAFGPWVFPLFRLLAKGKRLRGTLFDLFGHTAERRMERALIGECRALLEDVAGQMTPENGQPAVEIAAAIDLVAGYGPVKEAGVDAWRARVAALLPRLKATTPAVTPEPVTT